MKKPDLLVYIDFAKNNPLDIFIDKYSEPFIICFSNKKETSTFSNPNLTLTSNLTVDDLMKYATKTNQVQIIYPIKKSSHNSFSNLITVGRSNIHDISIQSRWLSRFHAYFKEDSGKYYLIDKNSTNGTFVNGERLIPNEPKHLSNGETINFSKLTFKFLDSKSAYTSLKNSLVSI